jgi:hypothetical protein
VQHVPDLFPYLKREIDRSPRSFRFLLSGSQHFELMKEVTESLAGRVAVLDLWPLAAQEVHGSRPAATIELLENPTRLDDLVGRECRVTDPGDVAPAMLAGGYPPVVLQRAGVDWFEAYRRTYVQRDIRELSQVADLGRFDRFLVLCAGRSGTVINKAEIAGVVGIDSKTVDHWLSLLETSYQIIALPAHVASATKRLVKRPKWVFADSGLGLHLQAIRDAHGLLNAPHFGHLFESFVIVEIRKLYGHAGLPWNGSFWRTPQGVECDLVLPAAGRLVPIEIRHTASPAGHDLKALNTFLDLYKKHARAGIFIVVPIPLMIRSVISSVVQCIRLAADLLRRHRRVGMRAEPLHGILQRFVDPTHASRQVRLPVSDLLAFRHRVRQLVEAVAVYDRPVSLLILAPHRVALATGAGEQSACRSNVVEVCVVGLNPRDIARHDSGLRREIEVALK